METAFTRVDRGQDAVRCCLRRPLRPLTKKRPPAQNPDSPAIALFAEKYALKYPKAVDCLVKDRQALTAFFDFPAEHWDHLRTANPIESVFATVRHRTVRTKGALSHKTATLIIFELVIAASRTWRRLKGENRLPMIVDGVTFRDGVENNLASLERAA